MGHAGPPSSSLLGGGANPNSEQPPLTIRVACEGEDCNALLEVPIPDEVRVTAPTALVVKCAQCKRMLEVKLNAEIYATYNAQLQAHKQSALIRQRQQELATLQALQMQLQAQQEALLNGFSSNLSPMTNNRIRAISGSQTDLQQQIQRHPHLQQQQFGSGGSGGAVGPLGVDGAQHPSFPMSPGSIPGLASMHNHRALQPIEPYNPNMQQLNQQLYNNNQQQHPQQQHPQQYQGINNPGQQYYQQQQPQQQQRVFPIMPLSTPAQLPSMPSAAALLAEYNQQQRQQQHQQYLNSIHPQLYSQHQQQYSQQQNMGSMGPGAGNINNELTTTTHLGGGGDGGSGGGGGGDNVYHQGNLQAPHQNAGGDNDTLGNGSMGTNAGRPATAGTTAAASPTVGDPPAAGAGAGGNDRVVAKKRTKDSPAPGETEKKARNEYNAYVKDEVKRLKAETPGMSSKTAFTQAAQTVSDAEVEENEDDEKQDEIKKNQETAPAGRKAVDDVDDTQPPMPAVSSPAAASPAAAATIPSPTTVAAAAAVAEATAPLEVKQLSQFQQQQQPTSPGSLIHSQRSLSDSLRRKLVSVITQGSGGDSGSDGGGGGVGRKVQFSKEEDKTPAEAGREQAEATITDNTNKKHDIQEVKQGPGEEGLKNKEEQGVVEQERERDQE